MTTVIYNRRKVDIHALLESIPVYFEGATTLYVEGTAITEDVEELYGKHSDGEEYDLLRQTFSSKTFRCTFSAVLFKELAAMSTRHAEPEIMDHMFIYQGATPLLTWYDAFWGDMEIDPSVPEQTVAAFASENELTVDKADHS